MEVGLILHMKGGTGENSYANNSLLSRAVIFEAKPTVEENIKEVYGNMLPECLMVADLGCSSGPNTLLVVSQILNAMSEICGHLNRRPPTFQLFLNDLPRTDFNDIFKSLPSFIDEVKKEKGDDFGPCFIVGAPGSFYDRLFPSNTMHFVHSSYSLQWLSQAPKELVTGEALNKENICVAKTSPPEVFKAYSDQYARDFTSFLRLRSEEMVPGGGMVLTSMGSIRSDDPCCTWEIVGRTLNEMVSEGLIEEEKLESFNLPYYAPCAEEAKKIIEAEGSFTLKKLQVFRMEWDPSMNREKGFDKQKSGEFVVGNLRAVGESILTNHFGAEIVNGLFNRLTEKIIDCMVTEKWPSINLIISLTKKGY